MSLIEPSIIDFIKRWKTPLVIGGLGFLLVGVALFLYDCGGDYLFKSKVQKQKDEIANEAKEIANISNQITELEKTKAAIAANVNTATQELQKDLSGLEEAKKETNQALANLQRAVNTNSNIDRTVDDLNRILEKLEE